MNVLGPLKTLLSPSSAGEAGQLRNSEGARGEGDDFSAILAHGEVPGDEANPASFHQMPSERHASKQQTAETATDTSPANSVLSDDGRGRFALGDQFAQVNQVPATAVEVKGSTQVDATKTLGDALALPMDASFAGRPSSSERPTGSPAPERGPTSSSATTGDGASFFGRASRQDSADVATSTARKIASEAGPQRKSRPLIPGEETQLDQISQPRLPKATALPNQSEPASASDARLKVDVAGTSEPKKSVLASASASTRWPSEPSRTGSEVDLRLRSGSDTSAKNTSEAAQQQEIHTVAGKTMRPIEQAKAEDVRALKMRSAVGAEGSATQREGQTPEVPRGDALSKEARRPVGEQGIQVRAGEKEAGLPGSKKLSGRGGEQRASVVATPGAYEVASDDKKPSGTVFTHSRAGNAESEETIRSPIAPQATNSRDQISPGRPSSVSSHGQETANIPPAKTPRPDAITRPVEERGSGTISNNQSGWRNSAHPAESQRPVRERGTSAQVADMHGAKPAALQPGLSADEARPSRVSRYSEGTPAQDQSQKIGSSGVPQAKTLASTSKASPAGVVDIPVSTLATGSFDTPAIGGASAPSAGVDVQYTASSTLSSLASQAGSVGETIRQLVDALPNHAAGDRTVLSLEPAELGHLEIEFKQDHGRMTATVSVERPETLDLLRRHADMLMRDLAAAGYAEAEVAFGDGSALGQRDQGHERDLNKPDDEAAWASETESVTSAASQRRGITAGRLDIRL